MNTFTFTPSPLFEDTLFLRLEATDNRRNWRLTQTSGPIALPEAVTFPDRTEAVEHARQQSYALGCDMIIRPAHCETPPLPS